MDEHSDKMKALEEELKDQQNKVIQAAEFGKMLLEHNEELQNKMDEIRKTTDKKLELLEQERYTIQVKLEQKASMEAWYNEEISHLKQQLADRQSNLRATLEADKLQEVSRLNRQIDDLRADLDQASVVEGQLKQKTSEMEDLLKERLNQTESDIGSRTFSSSEEVSVLHEEVENLQFEVTNLKSQLIEKKSELNGAVSEIENLRGRLVARDEELEDIKCQFTSVNNMLEEVRMEKLDLNCQLDALRMETSSHRKKGNSLFSELDDRRVEAENKLISLTVANQTLQEKYSVEKQQNNKYKRQISQLLLQMSSGRVDSEYVTNLEAKLAQARTELKTLMEEKSQLLQRQESEVKVVSELGQGETEDEDYKQYLVTVIKGKEQELQKTKQELNHKNLQLLDLKSRTSGQDAKIVQLEAEKDKLRSHNMKLSVKLEELRLKYDPDSVKKSGALVVKRTEKIPLDEQEEINITETTLNETAFNQSQMSLHPAHEKNSQPLAVKVDDNQKQLPVTKKSALSKCIKTKSVSISDDVEEHEIEKDSDIGSENKPDTKQKGRKLTAVKHISNVKPTMDVNECKSQ
ncbi:protein Spindly-like [Ruditapes philippinarum]|uniref:protein Spindly-like n=1 Tax=Ruditapes philippinarum TaxID=129788 RepID=UPI00295BAA7A|nr:protein Spindly-like [Ruditapes philippinarum]XP_060590959.1 protein Spindly-like [Ruditapes philippinarum]